MANNRSISPLHKFMRNILPPHRHRRRIPRLKPLRRRLRIINLNMHLPSTLPPFWRNTVFPMIRLRRYSLTSACQAACLGSVVLGWRILLNWMVRLGPPCLGVRSMVSPLTIFRTMASKEDVVWAALATWPLHKFNFRAFACLMVSYFILHQCEGGGKPYRSASRSFCIPSPPRRGDIQSTQRASPFTTSNCAISPAGCLIFATNIVPA